LHFLTGKFEEFSSIYNPYNVRAGLFLNLTLSTIKKKESTMKAMGEVLTGFLEAIAKGFTAMDKKKVPASEAMDFLKEEVEAAAS
ncbi:MAG: hypothetical protein QNL04_04665, partial [SAR324 cluster bacterium]|nr:hypothetical protein [SAR324 cluster bacterium]